jgi:hypothetical protein
MTLNKLYFCFIRVVCSLSHISSPDISYLALSLPFLHSNKVWDIHTLHKVCSKEFPSVRGGHLISINIYPWSMPLPLGMPKNGLGKSKFLLFSMCSHQVLNVFPNMFPIAPQDASNFFPFWVGVG